MCQCALWDCFLSVQSQSFDVIGVSKQSIRERIWDYMESHDIADFPRPVHHRIPNFKVQKLFLELLEGDQAFHVNDTQIQCFLVGWISGTQCVEAESGGPGGHVVF